ncbi:MAG: NADH-quinone oxidoreductase subunit N [Ruminiclostridium sp.]|nr:NADH-quinone oxidoreductase subunit N [Ruminiclostridium sp.]
MNYNAISIELLTVLLAIALLVIGLILPREKGKVAGYASVLALLAIFVFSFINRGNGTETFFNGLFVSDSLSVFFKQIFLVGAILVTVMALTESERFKDNRSEFFALIVFSLSGMMVLASANDFVTLYIGLELMTIPLVIMSAYHKDDVKSSEAGVKYVLLSALSSAVLLYGISLIYGISGSLVFTDILKHLQSEVLSPILLLAVIMMIAGFGFKISAVPFHMWSPDVYEGSPSSTTAFLAIASKAAGFAMLIRVVFTVISPAFDAFKILIIALACLTMIVGNLTAIPQKNIKRLLAYSSISHAGYILLGIVAYTQLGASAILYYLVLYIFGNTAAFASIIAFQAQTGSTEISDFAGMWKRSPFLAGVMLLSFLSLAGIPPAAGFTGKFFLFTAIIQQGYLWLAFLAIAMSVVSIYYYISVIRVLLMNNAVDAGRINIPAHLGVIMVISSAATLIMGIFPTPVLDWVKNVISSFLI